MKQKTIGIVGGAGPSAGAFLLERIFSLSRTYHNCYRDADFPKVLLISFPFSEMLCPTMDIAKLRRELKGCLNHLRDNGANLLVIACNTLHVFLEDEDKLDDLIHLPHLLAEKQSLGTEPLVFCTSTSVKFGLHKQFFPCKYPDKKTQSEIDKIIDQVLKEGKQPSILEKLEKIIQAQSAQTIIVGCTELSLFSAQLCIPNKQIIDPLEVVANRIIEKVFY